MIKKIKIVVVGHITLDEYNGKLVPGGSAYYCSQTYLALGAQVKLVSIIGEDFMFNEIFNDLDTFIKRIGQTTRFENIYKKDSVRQQFSIAQAEPIRPEAIPDDFKECDILHLAPVLGEIDIKWWVSLVKSKLVAIGLQGWLRRIDNSKLVLPKMSDLSDEEFKALHLICLSEEDIQGQSELLDRIIKFVPTVAFTHGENGYDIYKDGIKNTYGVFKTVEVDPTGAGDVFASGFFHGIASGKSEMEAGYLGAGLASVIIEDVGGKAFNRISEGISRANCIEYEVVKLVDVE